MNPYLSMATELIIGFFVLFVLTKLLGRNQFSQITPFDFISALVLGELLGNAVYDEEVNVQKILFSITIWGILIFSTEMLTQKFKKLRKTLEGEPTIVIHKGMLKYESLKKSKLDLNQLQNLVRQQGYFSLEEVEYAILETNGMVSVLPKSSYDIPKRSDLNLLSKPANLPVTLIIDGEVVYDNLKEAGFDEEWLKGQLAAKNVFDYKEVLFAEWREGKPFYIRKYA
ncbi:DUF421 domain-containing protein [Priestia endophytica]|uniref:DUF421 domain-containing protein n=1 Tax=Priestia endophytica TaxID=135735 RepID=UPI00227F77F9|nr:DUF421 domain-containing protein [Priestia endophytica]MCY8235077.1 DUF421 domain-containing protein [Priestia endophytica]